MVGIDYFPTLPCLPEYINLNIPRFYVKQQDKINPWHTAVDTGEQIKNNSLYESHTMTDGVS